MKDKKQIPTPLAPPLSGGNEERSTGPCSSVLGQTSKWGTTEVSVKEDKSGMPSSSPEKGRYGGVARGFFPYNKNLTALARANRRNPTKAENRMWNEVLRMRMLSDFKFLRQKPLAGYIVDFYCSELRLVIEIDGDSHAEAVEYDIARTETLNSLGLTVVRYTNHDVMQNIDVVAADLIQWIWG